MTSYAEAQKIVKKMQELEEAVRTKVDCWAGRRCNDEYGRIYHQSHDYWHDVKRAVEELDKFRSEVC